MSFRSDTNGGRSTPTGSETHAAGGTFAGWMAWNLALSENNAASLDVDAPVIALSWQDVGSGVGAFLFTALGLGWLERDEPAGQVIAAASVAGVVAMIFDIFVL